MSGVAPDEPSLAECRNETSLMVAVVLLREVIVVLISSPVFYKVESKVKGLTQDQKLLISNLRLVCFINQS